MNDKPQMYQLLGPEGYSDIPGAYANLDQLVQAAARFMLRFTKQGYYRDSRMEEVPLEDAANMLSVGGVEIRMTLTQAYAIYVNDNLERIASEGWVPLCYEEFLTSEECELLVDQDVRDEALEESLSLLRDGLKPFDPGRTECPGSSPDNGDRARWGEGILEHLNQWGGEPLQDYHFSDAISDLLHAVHKSGYSPSAAVQNAIGHFEAETNMEMLEEESEVTS